METCPRCQTRDQNLRNFCKKCGYKLLSPTLGLLQYIPRQRGYQGTLKEQLHTEGAGIKKSRASMTKEGLTVLLHKPDLVEEKKEKESKGLCAMKEKGIPAMAGIGDFGSGLPGRREMKRAYFPLDLSNFFSQKWAIFAGSIILSLVAAIIYCSAIHCAA